MTEKRIVRLTGPLQRRTAHQYIDDAPDGFVMRLSPPTRNLEQNALLHAVLTDISKQVEWCGKKFSLDIWKRLCVAAWLRERNEQPQMIPAIDGNGFDVIFEHTSKLTVKECAELVEWCLAFGAEHSVIWSDEARK